MVCAPVRSIIPPYMRTNHALSEIARTTGKLNYFYARYLALPSEVAPKHVLGLRTAVKQ